jgi:small subunit ribosomal protein S2
MKAIQLYASGVADAALDGKAAVPALPAGEDEFVELDEEGQPRKKAQARAPRRAANVRRKPPVRTRQTAETASAATMPVTSVAYEEPATAAAAAPAAAPDAVPAAAPDAASDKAPAKRRPAAARKTEKNEE